jgi:hypothetical protein
VQVEITKRFINQGTKLALLTIEEKSAKAIEPEPEPVSLINNLYPI